MNDKEFLQWIYDRMKDVHNENENVDYMLKLKSVIKKHGFDPDTNTMCVPFTINFNLGNR